MGLYSREAYMWEGLVSETYAESMTYDTESITYDTGSIPGDSRGITKYNSSQYLSC